MDELDSATRELETIFQRRRQQKAAEAGSTASTNQVEHPHSQPTRRRTDLTALLENKILELICCFFTVIDHRLAVPGSVSRRWHRASNSAVVWQTLCRSYYLPAPSDPLMTLVPSSSSGPKPSVFSSRIGGLTSHASSSGAISVDEVPKTAKDHFRIELAKKKMERERQAARSAAGYGPRPHGNFSSRVLQGGGELSSMEEGRGRDNRGPQVSAPKHWQPPSTSIQQDLHSAATGTLPSNGVTTNEQEQQREREDLRLPIVLGEDAASVKVQRIERKLEVYRRRLDNLEEGSAALEAPIKSMTQIDQTLLAESERQAANVKQIEAAASEVHHALLDTLIRKNRKALVSRFEQLVISRLHTPASSGSSSSSTPGSQMISTPPLLLGTFAQLEMHTLSSSVFGSTLSLRWNLLKRCIPVDEKYFDSRDWLLGVPSKMHFTDDQLGSRGQLNKKKKVEEEESSSFSQAQNSVDGLARALWRQVGGDVRFPITHSARADSRSASSFPHRAMLSITEGSDDHRLWQRLHIMCQVVAWLAPCADGSRGQGSGSSFDEFISFVQERAQLSIEELVHYYGDPEGKAAAEGADGHASSHTTNTHNGSMLRTRTLGSYDMTDEVI